MRPIVDVAKELGLAENQLDVYGKLKAKIRLSTLKKDSRKKMGKLILVTAMTPTPHGEGKTVTSIGLSMGLWRHGFKSLVCLRQPSLGPVFGVKGGATGAGLSKVEPSDEINLRFTGDLDAVAAAHNLLAAIVDNHLYYGNNPRLDPLRIVWKRTLDVNDRALRDIIVGIGDKHAVTRETGFVITAASEVLAILSLARDYHDLKDRLSRIIVGFSINGEPVTAGDLKASGAMAALLRDALEPNLVQTTEGTPAFVHGGCFGNIAQGTTTVTSIRLGLRLADYCIVEAGFGTDLGAEKFVDIVAPVGGFNVDATILVVSIQALKHHGGHKGPLNDPDVKAVEYGLANLEKHIDNIHIFGMNPIVTLNKFPTDTSEEINIVQKYCEKINVPFTVSTCYQDGGNGVVELVKLVLEAVQLDHNKMMHPYWEHARIADKVETIVRRIYGGDGTIFSSSAREKMKELSRLGFDDKPVCIAKTPLSLSHDSHSLGRPRDFTPYVKDIVPAAGAGYVVVDMGDVIMMPGLPKVSLAEKITLNDDGMIVGVE